MKGTKVILEEEDRIILKEKDKVLLVKEIKVILKEDKALAVINIEFNNNKVVDISKTYILYFY